MAEFHSLKATQLEKTLGSTIYAKYKGVMDNYILRDLKNGTFSIPVIQTLVSNSKNLEVRLIELYDRKLATVDTSHISDELKVLQASLFDGLVFGINIEKGMEMNIYTANPNAIFNFSEDCKFSLDKTLELNEQGIVHAVRIDIEYTSEDGFMFKPVTLNKNTNLKVVDLDTMEGRFLLVPYIAIQRSMVFFKEQLDDGRTLEITQERGEVLKVRNVSAKGTELAKYCDDENFAKFLKPEYFPLKGFFYAPSLGASSYTTGMTRIELLTVNKVANVVKPKVEKAQGFESVLDDSVIHYLVSEMYKYDEETYLKVVDKLPKKEKHFPNDMSDKPTANAFITYYRQLSSSDKDKVRNLLEIANFSNVKSAWGSLINRSEKVNTEGLTKDDIQNMLKQGIYKILVRKKDCTFTSLMVTNNKGLLEDMYGVNYFSEYESLGVRLFTLENLIENGNDVQESMLDCGFKDKMHLSGKVADIFKNKVGGESIHVQLANLLGETEDGDKKSVRRGASNPNVVLARACFATISGSGSSEYYKYIDVSRIVSITRVG